MPEHAASSTYPMALGTKRLLHDTNPELLVVPKLPLEEVETPPEEELVAMATPVVPEPPVADPLAVALELVPLVVPPSSVARISPPQAAAMGAETAATTTRHRHLESAESR
jgi:hypothetical protein